MSEETYETYHQKGSVPIKAWTRGVLLDDKAKAQLQNVAKMSFVYSHVAAMPDVHWGLGATVGSVIPCEKAVIPAAVGVDIGCGMMAVQTSLKAEDLPINLKEMRRNIEEAVPHGRSHHGGRGDAGSWSRVPGEQAHAWQSLKGDYEMILERNPKLNNGRINHVNHLGTLGTGNHFIEICLDEKDQVWAMLHSGSRGVGNRIGKYFIELAKQDMKKHLKDLPDQDLAYLKEGTVHFDDYVHAVQWAQRYARTNRELMMDAVLGALLKTDGVPPFTSGKVAVNCHHNYVARERHYGRELLITRKGAVRAGKGELGIIPGSMGARSYIVRGKGNAESFESCAHGAGRAMSRNEARRRFSVQDHREATKDVECRKDEGVLDETPAAYKSIDEVMAAQNDLVEIEHTLRQIVCVKG